ncbi:Protein KlcB [Frankliniella fusca]|uniref:Protein KlcB n=1 Tax=Frankliniella fusca TaxID=407009 RepID=A0AAE1LID4_9NEOP|nr:Protein KlcB [Frankliniella fusca]
MHNVLGPSVAGDYPLCTYSLLEVLKQSNHYMVKKCTAKKLVVNSEEEEEQKSKKKKKKSKKSKLVFKFCDVVHLSSKH